MIRGLLEYVLHWETSLPLYQMHQLNFCNINITVEAQIYV